jgi:hypothetical protein
VLGKEWIFIGVDCFGRRSKGIKYHLLDRETVCSPKDLGGLGVLNLDLINICLLCKWLWKLENEDGVRQDILKKKNIFRKRL